jgi:hypothetical protein
MRRELTSNQEEEEDLFVGDSIEREEGEGRGRESRLLAPAKSVSTASIQEDGNPSGVQ